MVWDVTEIQQEIVLLPELPDVPSRTQDPQSVYNTKAFNFRAAERELQQKFNINVRLLNVVLKSSTVILPNMDAINTVSGAVGTITTVSEHVAEVSAVSGGMAAVNAVSGNMASIIAVSGQGTEIAAVAANMPAVLAAPDAATAADASAHAALASSVQAGESATTAGQSAQDAAASAGQAATSATDAGTSASSAAQSSAKARAWAENAEDTPVETGKFSALHWAAKSRNAALTALGGIPLIEAGDDGRALVADGETLAWVKGPAFTATPSAGAVPKADASGKLNAWVDVPPPWSPGDIKMWFGELDTSGKHPLINGGADTRWHICDGTDGTPDMRDRVPLGASASKTKGTTGGSADHTHTVSVSVAAHPETACTGATASASPSGSCAAAYSGVSSSTGSAAVSGSVGSTTLSVSQMPSHNHIIRNGATGTGTIPPMALIEGTANTTPTQYAGGSGSHTHSFSGGSHSHSISESTHSHSVSVSAHTHGIGTVKTPPLAHSASGSSAEANSLPPYVALHFLMYIGE